VLVTPVVEFLSLFVFTDDRLLLFVGETGEELPVLFVIAEERLLPAPELTPIDERVPYRGFAT
jgi:hypothetical protein